MCAFVALRKAACGSQESLNVFVLSAEAAKQIFSPTESADSPPWDGTGLEFSGSIQHHESQRIRAMYEAVKSTREAITGRS